MDARAREFTVVYLFAACRSVCAASERETRATIRRRLTTERSAAALAASFVAVAAVAAFLDELGPTFAAFGRDRLDVLRKGQAARLPSPGACESGTYNGNTVAAGVTGRTHQKYNGTVIGTLSGATCGTGCVDTTSILDTLFKPGWAWVILPDGGHWTWTGHYEAGSHGTWFDTSVNWPLNDRGDITSG